MMAFVEVSFLIAVKSCLDYMTAMSFGSLSLIRYSCKVDHYFIIHTIRVPGNVRRENSTKTKDNPRRCTPSVSKHMPDDKSREPRAPSVFRAICN